MYGVVSLRLARCFLEIKANSTEHDGIKHPLKLELYHLKFIEIRNVKGQVQEIEYLKVLLINAMSLKKMTVSTPKKFATTNERKMKMLIEEIQAMPRASLDCEIHFCVDRTNKF